MRRIVTGFVALFIVVGIGSAQKRAVPPTESMARLWMIDSVDTDPHTKARRPSHADQALGYVVVAYSKDGKSCVVEYLLSSQAEKAKLHGNVNALNDPHTKSFDKSTTKPEDFEAAVKAAGFDNVDLK